MKRILTIIVLIIILCWCAINFSLAYNHDNDVGNNDWSYSLPNGYVIWHVNSRNIVCGKIKSEYSISTISEKYVAKFCYDNQYVCLQCVDASDNLSIEIDKSNPRYYILNTLNDTISEPMSEELFYKTINDMNMAELSQWEETYPRPNDAQFP